MYIDVYISKLYISNKIIYNLVGDIMNIYDLSIKEKIGQRLMFGVNSDNIDLIVDLVRDYAIGGVILYKRNYRNYGELLDVIKRLKDANKNNKISLFIAIDQEGGRVNRMPNELVNIKNIYDISKNNKNLLYDNGLITGRMLSLSGINMNFSPVLDIYDENSKNKVLYKRCFYGDVDNIVDSAKKYIKGFEDNNVISVIKHFPGHGSTNADSHFMVPYIYDYKNILDKHIRPFYKIIDDGVDVVMVGHLVIRKLTNGLPASISSNFIKNYLRDGVNYQGVIISDEINMLSRSFLYKFIYEKRVIKAGSDIILVKLKNKKNALRLINKYMKTFEKDEEQLKMLDDSVLRILKIKEKYNISDSIDNLGCGIDLINQEIIKINKECK